MVTEETRGRKGKRREFACGFIHGDKAASWHIPLFKKPLEKYGQASLQVNKSYSLSQTDDKWWAIMLWVCFMPRDKDSQNTNSTSYWNHRKATALASAGTENLAPSCQASGLLMTTLEVFLWVRVWSRLGKLSSDFVLRVELRIILPVCFML